jgi:hypothetical protein
MTSNQNRLFGRGDKAAVFSEPEIDYYLRGLQMAIEATKEVIGFNWDEYALKPTPEEMDYWQKELERHSRILQAYMDGVRDEVSFLPTSTDGLDLMRIKWQWFCVGHSYTLRSIMAPHYAALAKIYQ